jgi:hypothetical protein
MPKQHRAIALAQELGLYNTQVIFQSGWVPYDVLHNHLLDADIGVSAHFDSLETHFSFRTRILSYLWAGKPIITTQGDVLADEIARHRAGIVVNPTDEEAWIAAIEKLHNPKNYATYIDGVRMLAFKYRWSNVTQSLLSLCANASRAPDRIVENGLRKSQPRRDCEHDYNALQLQKVALEQQLDFLENSHSMRLTAPLRTLRRWLTHWKT